MDSNCFTKVSFLIYLCFHIAVKYYILTFKCRVTLKNLVEIPYINQKNNFPKLSILYKYMYILYYINILIYIKL